MHLPGYLFANAHASGLGVQSTLAPRTEEGPIADAVADWVALIHERYPPSEAEEWDNVGLQVGDPAWTIERVLVALDVTSAVVAEAADGPPTLVVAHHPLLFRPLTRLTPDTAGGRIALAAAHAGVAVLAAHTNLDVADDGTSDPIMRALGIEQSEPLTATAPRAGEVKLVTFVPPDHVDPVLDALSAAGAGVIGEYERCSFRVRGTGTFRPRPHASPYAGEVGVDNAENEDRLEIVMPRRRLAAVVRALLAAHPYEEVAYDVYPLVAAAPRGLGRVGELPQERTLKEVADALRERLPAPHLRYAGPPGRPIRRIAAVGGAGDSLIPAARVAGADVLVTGDLRHHVTLDALETGLALIDAGHHATEVAVIPAWVETLRQAGRERELEAAVVASQVSTVPWTE